MLYLHLGSVVEPLNLGKLLYTGQQVPFHTARNITYRRLGFPSQHPIHIV